MTTIGLQYLQHTEQERHNRRMELETERSNREKERLTAEANQETARANLASEANTRYSIDKQSENTKYSADRHSASSIYGSNTSAANVNKQIVSSEKISSNTLEQRERESVRSAETTANTSGLNTLTNLFNTLVGAVTKSSYKKGK